MSTKLSLEPNGNGLQLVTRLAVLLRVSAIPSALTGCRCIRSKPGQRKKRQLKAQAELRDLEWERFHQSTAFESEKTAAAHSPMEGASTETTQPVDSLQEFVKRGANYVRIERASPRPGEFIYTCESDGSFLAVGKVQEEEQEGGE